MLFLFMYSEEAACLCSVATDTMSGSKVVPKFDTPALRAPCPETFFEHMALRRDTEVRPGVVDEVETRMPSFVSKN